MIYIKIILILQTQEYYSVWTSRTFIDIETVARAGLPFVFLLSLPPGLVGLQACIIRNSQTLFMVKWWDSKCAQDKIPCFHPITGWKSDTIDLPVMVRRKLELHVLGYKKIDIVFCIVLQSMHYIRYFRYKVDIILDTGTLVLYVSKHD